MENITWGDFIIISAIITMVFLIVWAAVESLKEKQAKKGGEGSGISADAAEAPVPEEPVYPTDYSDIQVYFKAKTPVMKTNYSKPAQEPVIPVQDSLDSQYAAGNGMWVCPYCQALNPGSQQSCSSCGMRK